MSTKKFDGTTMRGRTQEDNITILECHKNNIEMTVDENGRVWNEGGVYS